ncbi:MAG TPA: hypothetical protein VJ841_00455 [Candidatus Saccharimonadales bacterium]|nr:hypothetical protein [Candidatus Saccharimonadales bacterium]
MTSTAFTFSELGHGAQFKAFDMHNDRVLKIPLTEAETYQVARRRRNIIHGTIDQIASLDVRVQTFMNSKARIPSMVSHSLEDPEPFLKLLGNPKVEYADGYLPEDTHEKRWASARFIYTQDKVDTAAEMLRFFEQTGRLGTGDVLRLKRYIEQYVANIHETWCYGYSDYIFKLGDSGIDKDGNMILIDLGEWTMDLAFIKRAVAEKWWLDNVNHQKKDFPKLPSKLEPFYTQTLEGAFTVAELEKRWRSKHICAGCTEEATTIAAFVSTKVAEIDYIDRL